MAPFNKNISFSNASTRLHKIFNSFISGEFCLTIADKGSAGLALKYSSRNALGYVITPS